MSQKSLDELIDGEIDGTNEPDDAQQLARALETDPALADRLEAHRRAARALRAAEQAEPPAGLAESVMDTLRHGAAARQLSIVGRVLGFRAPRIAMPVTRRQEWTGGEAMTSRKVLLGIAAAAVIAIGYFAVRGFPPVGPGAEGTVGAAKRYQSSQINDRDVVIGDAQLQDVLQSDAFNKLISDPAARKAVASDAFQKALADSALREALGNQAIRDALGSQAMRDALGNQAIRDALGNQAVRDALGSQAMRDALNSQAMRDRLGDQAYGSK